MALDVLVSHLRTGVDAALRESEDTEQLLARVQALLQRMAEEGEFSFPPEFSAPDGDHYARRLLYNDPVNGTSAVLMTWGQGQATPIHDHAGLWCVECVVSGTMEVRRFDLQEQQGDRCRFVPSGTVVAAVGSTGSLIPPFEYHVLANLSDRESLTLHIYGGAMNECHIYPPAGDGWHIRTPQRLSFTD